MTVTFALTACIGAFGFAFIDNACHLGGALTGALVGHVTITPDGASEPSADLTRQVGQAGWFAATVLVAGALATIVLLIRGI